MSHPEISAESDRAACAAMIAKLRSQGIRDERVLQAMTDLPRHVFVPQGQQEHAYADRPVDIGAGQTISQPYMVASMLQHAAPAPGDVVLEVGGGCGYMAALLSRFCSRVIAIERIPELAEASRGNLARLHIETRLHIENVEVHVGDGSLGWPAGAPYNVIVVSAAAPSVPSALMAQLSDGGRILIPVGSREDQTLFYITKQGGEISRRELYGCKFVPLIGVQGFASSESIFRVF